MHILVVNDDGPPSAQSSPYVLSLVRTLQEAGHTVSVVLPHTQRSWIGKAHMIGQTVKPTYYRPGADVTREDGTTHSRPLPAGSPFQEEWILVDGTPASCVQIGLYHYFQDLGPIDLVVSGPNYGRNSTAVFALSSGTLGGALEAAVCKKKAIAVSYAFESRNHDPVIIAGAARQSVKVIEHLYGNWGPDVDLYSVNVPLIEGVEGNKVMITNMLQNYWGPKSCFEEVTDPDDDAVEAESRIREAEERGPVSRTVTPTTKHKHKHFKWSPRFSDVYKSVEMSDPGNDGWALKHGYTSVTPLKSNFMHPAAGSEGELKLESLSKSMASLSISKKPPQHLYAVVDYGDTYVQPLILSALAHRLPRDSYTLIDPSSAAQLSPSSLILLIQQYEALPFEKILSSPHRILANSYIVRKALIRKHYLALTVESWVAKHPTSILASNVKPSCHFEVDYAEFLEDALVEAWELNKSMAENEDRDEQDREWWILKPGMSDRGQGIRLFSSLEELQGIFDGWEAATPDSDDENSALNPESPSNSRVQTQERSVSAQKKEPNDAIMTSQLRHFIAQPYIHPPLLLPSNPRKFHIRTYVVAVGALRVYVYRPMLALFAASPYSAPWESSDMDTEMETGPGPGSGMPDLKAHLTNTCLQDGSRDGSVVAFWDLPLSPPPFPVPKSEISTPSITSPPQDWRAHIQSQILTTTADIFEAASRTQMIHFQTLPNAFEIFGLDFLVDEKGKAWLLECNSFPDFGQTGGELKELVAGLWQGVVEIVVLPAVSRKGEADKDDEDGKGEWKKHVKEGTGLGDGKEGTGLGDEKEETGLEDRNRGEKGETGDMLLVLDIDLGRR